MNQPFSFFKQYLRGCLLVLTIALMTGCRTEESLYVQGENSDEAMVLTRMLPPTENSLVSPPDSILIMTETPVIIPSTVALSSSVTPAFALTPTATKESEAIITSTTIPTVMIVTRSFEDLMVMFERREALFKEFMATNGGCELPCWWGVSLGDTLENSRSTSTDFKLPPLDTDHDQIGNYSTDYADYHEDEQGRVAANVRLSANMEFYEIDDSIEYIYVNVTTRANSEKGQQELIRDWEQYFINSFLQKYGKPTQVYFRIKEVGDLMLTPQFSISLLYREQGLAITYHIEAMWLNEEYTQAEICLDIENLRSLELSLFNPDGFDQWGYRFAPYHDELYEPLTWEAETGMTLDVFYETYQTPEDGTCIVVRSD